MIQKIINLNKWYDNVEEPWRFLLLIAIVTMPQLLFNYVVWGILMMILVIFRMIAIYYKK
jgi:hypothetical protein